MRRVIYRSLVPPPSAPVSIRSDGSRGPIAEHNSDETDSSDSSVSSVSRRGQVPPDDDRSTVESTWFGSYGDDGPAHVHGSPDRVHESPDHGHDDLNRDDRDPDRFDREPARSDEVAGTDRPPVQQPMLLSTDGGTLLDRLLGGPVPSALVLSAILVFCLVFGYAHVQNHRAFATYSYDTGIYDQAVWALAHDRNAFITVRGLYVLGHHVNLILYLLVPISLLGGGASAFLVTQTVIIAAGAWPVYLIGRTLFGELVEPSGGALGTARFRRGRRTTLRVAGRDRFGPLMAAGLAIAYLLSPVVQWVNQAHWHPEAFSATAILWSWWFALQRRWKGYAVAVLLALATREETALSVAALGVVLVLNNRSALRGLLRSRADRMKLLPGFLTIAVASAWFLIATKIIIPAFNDGRPPYFYAIFFETFGGSATGVIRTVVTNPGLVVSTLTKPDRTGYLLDLGLPTLFTFVLSPVHCLMMVPTLASNLLTDNQYAREIRYQYAAVLIGPMWIATLHGVNRFRRMRNLRRWVAAMVVLAALVTNVKFSPSPLSSASEQAWWRPTDVSRVQQAAVDIVPEDAGVSATYFMLTHLDQRRHIYDWPNPFQPTYWGNYDPISPTPDPDPLNVQWIVVDRATMDDAGLELLDLLTAPGGRFEVYFDEADVVVAGPVRTPLRRVEPDIGADR